MHRTLLILLLALVSDLSPAQWALGPQFLAFPQLDPFTARPALGAHATRTLGFRWQLFADAWISPPSSGSYSGLVDPRRQLASGTSDTTIRMVDQEWCTLPYGFAVGACARMGDRRRSSARAHRYWSLSLNLHRTRRISSWNATGVYSGTYYEGEARWTKTALLFSPGIGHRTRVHGRKRYYLEIRPGIGCEVGVDRKASAVASLGIATGVTWSW